MDEKKYQATLKVAEKIIKCYEFKGAPDPNCYTCLGSGEYEEESHYNGDYFMMICPCVNRNRPPSPWLSPHDEELYLLAKHFTEIGGFEI